MKKKWKYLRDQFRSELRKTPTPKSGDAGDTASEITSTWPYFQSLLFLKDQMKYRNLSGNLKPGKFKNSQEEEYENEDIHNTSQVEESEEMCESFETNPESRPKRKRTANSSSAELLEIEKRKFFCLKKKMQKKTVLDEDEAFFLTLLPHIRKLEPEKKFLCRMEMQNTLYKYVYGKANSLPQLCNERSRYKAISSPISTSSENVYSMDLSTSGHFQSSTFVPIEITNEPTTSSFASIQIGSEPSLDQIQTAKETSIYYTDSIYK